MDASSRRSTAVGATTENGHRTASSPSPACRGGVGERVVRRRAVCGIAGDGTWERTSVFARVRPTARIASNPNAVGKTLSLTLSHQWARGFAGRMAGLASSPSPACGGGVGERVVRQRAVCGIVGDSALKRRAAVARFHWAESVADNTSALGETLSLAACRTDADFLTTANQLA